MKSEDARTEERAENTDADGAIAADLRLRLQGSLEQELAARAEARRLACELALARRLLKFSASGSTPVRQAKAADIPRLRAAHLEEEVIYHIDACQNHGTHTTLSGWAFRPASGWDSRDTTITLLFRHGVTTYYAATGCMPRPDVAAHYAAQPPQASGGARGLDGAGFACEILHDSLPAKMEWEITLRLECAGMMCEQPTAQRLQV